MRRPRRSVRPSVTERRRHGRGCGVPGCARRSVSTPTTTHLLGPGPAASGTTCDNADHPNPNPSDPPHRYRCRGLTSTTSESGLGSCPTRSRLTGRRIPQGNPPVGPCFPARTAVLDRRSASILRWYLHARTAWDRPQILGKDFPQAGNRPGLKIPSRVTRSIPNGSSGPLMFRSSAIRSGPIEIRNRWAAPPRSTPAATGVPVST